MAVFTVLAGCEATILKPTEADTSRAEVQRLREQVDQLQRRQRELEQALAAASVGSTSPEIAENTPRATDLELASIRLVPRDMAPTHLRLEVVPTDGLGRFVQVVGWLEVNAVALGGESATQAAPISAAFGPAAVREAYRAGFMRARYEFELPLPAGADARASWAVEVRFRDGLSNRTLTATGIRSPSSEQSGEAVSAR